MTNGQTSLPNYDCRHLEVLPSMFGGKKKKLKRKGNSTGHLLYVRICSDEGGEVGDAYCWLGSPRLFPIPPHAFKSLSSVDHCGFYFTFILYNL